jgi:bacteriocin biosynthesis cyclodehydratase domain-containing protein
MRGPCQPRYPSAEHTFAFNRSCLLRPIPAPPDAAICTAAPAVPEPWPLRWNSAWRALYEDGLLLITAGADEIFAIEDVPAEIAADIIALGVAPEIRRETLSRAASDLLEQLLTAGIVDAAPVGPAATVALCGLGDAAEELTARLSAALVERGLELVEPNAASFVVLLRAGGPLRALLAQPDGLPTQPHLLIDLAYHHTCSLGPLVFPGQTACLGCLVSRVSTQWGDALPPARPRMAAELDLAVGLAALEIERVTQGEHSLVNRTVAYDFSRRQVKDERLFKLPWCPVCAGEAPKRGALQLPWAPAPC